MEHAVRRDETNSRVDPIRTRELGDRQDEFESMKQQNPQRVFYNKTPAGRISKDNCRKSFKDARCRRKISPIGRNDDVHNPNNFAHVGRTFEHLKGR